MTLSQECLEVSIWRIQQPSRSVTSLTDKMFGQDQKVINCAHSVLVENQESEKSIGCQQCAYLYTVINSEYLLEQNYICISWLLSTTGVNSFISTINFIQTLNPWCSVELIWRWCPYYLKIYCLSNLDSVYLNTYFVFQNSCFIPMCFPPSCNPVKQIMNKDRSSKSH